MLGTTFVRRTARLTTISAIGVVLASSVALQTITSVLASSGVNAVGKISIGTCSVRGAVDDSAKGIVLLVVDRGESGCTGGPGHGSGADGGIWLGAYSVSTLNPVAAAELVMPAASPSCNLTPVSMQAVVIDAARQLLYLPCASEFPTFANQIAVYDIGQVWKGSALEPKTVINVPDNPAQLFGAGAGGSIVSPRNPSGPPGDYNLIPTGLFVDASGASVYVVLSQYYGGQFSYTSARGAATQDMYVAAVSLATGSVQWVEQLGECEYSTTHAFFGATPAPPDPILHVQTGSVDSVFVGCLSSRAPGVAPDPFGSSVNGLIGQAGSMVVYDIALDAHTSMPVPGAASFTLGRPNTLTGYADAADGRLFSVNAPNSDGGQYTAVTFDAPHDAYVGATTVGLSAGGQNVPGLATANGRLYSAGVDGIRVADVTGTPPGQGVQYPGNGCATQFVLADPSSHRLFVNPVSGCTRNSGSPSDAGTYLFVYQDDAPALGPNATVDPDSYTTQLAGQSGVGSSAQYSGHGESTGARIRVVGGTTGLVRGATLGLSQVSPQQGGVPSLEDQLSQLGGPFAPDFSNHELDLAQVKAADLDNYKASANSLAVGVDDATGQTYSSQGGPAQSWPFGTTACDNTGTAQQSNTYGSDTGSTATCSSNAATSADGTAASGPLGLSLTVANAAQSAATLPASTSLPISVGSATAESHVYLDPQHGVMITSTASVHGVNLGVASIDSISAVTTCVAAGQRGTAGCTYARSFGGVVVGGKDFGACQDDGTGSNVSSCQTIFQALNSIDPGYIVFSSPGPDGRGGYVSGSPGGYQAVAQRELYKHLQDSVINSDTSVQIPALEIVYVNDSPTNPSRVDIQLANVEGESHYGVSLLPAGFSSDGPLGPLSGIGGPPPATSVSSLGAVAASAGGADNGGGGLGGLFNRLFQHLLQGLAWLVRSPGAALAASVLLFMLGSPLFMAQRRRRLGLLEGTT